MTDRLREIEERAEIALAAMRAKNTREDAAILYVEMIVRDVPYLLYRLRKAEAALREAGNIATAALASDADGDYTRLDSIAKVCRAALEPQP
jgi:hypothetical protein